MSASAAPAAPPSGRRRRLRIWGIVLGMPLVLILLIVLLFRWDWLIPIVEARASAALGRKVTIQHLHVALGRVTHIVADDVVVNNPEGFTDPTPLLQTASLAVDVDAMAYIQHRVIVLPDIAFEKPRLAVLGTADGKNNYTFDFGPPANADASKPAAPSTSPTIGKLEIHEGEGHVLIPKLRTDAQLKLATRDAPGGVAGQAPQVVVDAKGTYGGQPVTAQLIAGGLLSLRDAAQPFPIDLKLQNGPTKASLVGTILDPLKFAGADLDLAFTGPDMALLLPLTGIALPKTPTYSIKGKLDYADRRVQFRNFVGQIGSSDVEGSIAIDPGAARPDVIADLHSRKVDLQDLAGFIGSEPGRVDTPNLTPAQRQAVARAEASSQLVPNTPLNLGKLRAADIHLKYKGDKIAGRSVPFDTLKVTADIVDGAVNLHPVELGVGSGQIIATISLVPQKGDQIHAKADVKVQRLDVSRLMASTHAYEGSGRLGGDARIEATGNSLAAMLGAGDGSLNLYMSGGSLNALLVDLSGLHFGQALLSALGIPQEAKVECLIGQFGLRNGVLASKTLLLDTSEAIVNGTGSIDLSHERVNLSIKTDAKHFTVGSLPAAIGITGPFKNLSVAPDLAAIGIRGGAAAGLGFLFPPLAILPLIQLGVGDDNRCGRLVKRSG